MAAFVPEVWQARMEEVAAALREVAPERIVFFEGIPMAGLAHVDAFVPAADPRTALAPHYYHPLLHEGVAYRPVHFAQVEAGFDAIAEMAHLLGDVPVWLGEFGVHTQVPSQYDFLDAMLVDLARRRWGWAYWSDDRGDAGFSLRDSKGDVKPALASRLGHPYARRVPGPLLEQALHTAAGTYTAGFRWTRDAPTRCGRGPCRRPGAGPSHASNARESKRPGASRTTGSPACGAARRRRSTAASGRSGRSECRDPERPSAPPGRQSAQCAVSAPAALRSEQRGTCLPRGRRSRELDRGDGDHRRDASRDEGMDWCEVVSDDPLAVGFGTLVGGTRR